MGAFADAIVIIMLVIAAVIAIALLVTALKQVGQSPISILRKLTWVIVLVCTVPIGLVLWFAFGYGDLRRQREIEYHKEWASRLQTDAPAEADAVAN